MKDVTLFITSCGRPNLMKITFESFVKYNTYPIKKVILCEDSGNKGIVDFIKNLSPYQIEIFYNEQRIGQMKTIEKYIKYVNTPFVFHLEDDYEFFDYGFIELSFKILDSDPNISQVLLQDEQHFLNWGYKEDIGNPLCYRLLTNNPYNPGLSNGQNCCNNGDGALNVFSWRPSLKRLDIALLRIPYELWDDEYTIQLEINKRGYYAVVSKIGCNKTPKGFCKHIGETSHVSEFIKGTNKKIISRIDFPNKMKIRLKDI